MSNTNDGSRCNSNYGTTGNGSANYGNTSATRGSASTSTRTGTCTATTPGTTLEVGNITAPGCYVCNWNGSLLRINESCFTSEGTTAFSFHGCDPLTVTYLSDDPTTSVESCRTIATHANTFCNF